MRNASLWLDLKIMLMTLRIMSRSYLRSAEAAADLAQVQVKRADLSMAVSLVTHEPVQKLPRAAVPSAAGTGRIDARCERERGR